MSEVAPTLYLDLDGTLLDIREKYYRLHCRIAADLGHETLSQDAFWAQKRRGMALDVLLPDWSDGARAEYSRRWLEEIELPLYTRFDRLVPGARESLALLAPEFELVLVTLRRDGQGLRRQLRRLGLDQLFSRLLVSGDHGGAEVTKVELLGLADPRERFVVVGDTEEDVRAARALGGPVIGVLTGLRDKTFLAALNPNLIIESVAQLPEVVWRVVPPLAPNRSSLMAGAS